MNNLKMASTSLKVAASAATTDLIGLLKGAGVEDAYSTGFNPWELPMGEVDLDNVTLSHSPGTIRVGNLDGSNTIYTICAGDTARVEFTGYPVNNYNESLFASAERVSVNLKPAESQDSAGVESQGSAGVEVLTSREVVADTLSRVLKTIGVEAAYVPGADPAVFLRQFEEEGMNRPHASEFLLEGVECSTTSSKIVVGDIVFNYDNNSVTFYNVTELNDPSRDYLFEELFNSAKSIKCSAE